MKTYIVQQPFRGTATYLVQANTAAEAKDKVNEFSKHYEDVECVDRDTNWIGRASYARLDRAKPKE